MAYLAESNYDVAEIVDNFLFLIEEDKDLLQRLINNAINNGYGVEFSEINEPKSDCYYHFGLCLENVTIKSFTEGTVNDFRLSVIVVGDEDKDNPVCLKNLNIVDFLELSSRRVYLSHTSPYSKGMIKDVLQKYLENEKK